MKIMCPAKFAYGHANYIHSDFGHYILPRDTDLTYELEVISCKHDRWDSLGQVALKVDESGAAVSSKLSIHDEQKVLKAIEAKILKLKTDIVELDKLVIKQETDSATSVAKVVSVAKKNADTTEKVNEKKAPEQTSQEKKEKEDELQITKDLLFLAKNNLVKVETAMNIAKVAVSNEKTVVKAVETMADVKIKEPKSVGIKAIEKQIEVKVDEPAAVREAKEPKTNEERNEENSS